ncbi:unnamed protein product [Symbiodinium natans]|uniref:Uncharacterized protein n=1 Tax=Symbiodinium natans TaxID=878477 RepID=A0A812L6E9_9DINO|nr:unnamed protein product [Symbiodinium natans]
MVLDVRALPQVALSVAFAFCACQSRRTVSHFQQGKLQEAAPLVDSIQDLQPENEPCCFCFRSPFRRQERGTQWRYVKTEQDKGAS